MPTGSSQARPPAPDVPFVGRADVLTRLHAAADAALAASGSVVLVRGAPGSGKTRSCEEAALYATRRGMRLTSGHCVEAGGAPPLWPWIQILRSLDANDSTFRERARARHPLLETLLTRDVEIDPDAGAPEEPGEQLRLLGGLAELLLGEARAAPQLLLLEDLHDADLLSLRALESVHRRAGEGRLLVLTTIRSHAFEGEGRRAAILGDLATRASTVDLTPLSEGEVLRALELAVGPRATRDLSSAVFERTGGNALLLVELIRVIAGSESAAVLELPRTLARTLRHRLVPLGESHERVLQVAAVLGDDFEAGLVAEIGKLDEESVENALEEARAHRLLQASAADVFHFAHALIREELARRLKRTERAELHRAAAHALRRRNDPKATDAILYHLEQAEGGRPSQETLTYRLLAARRAAAHLAWEDAARHYEMALEGCESQDADAETLAELWMDLGVARARSSEPAEAAAAFAKVRELARSAGLPRLLGRAAIGAVGDLRTGSATQSADPERVALVQEALAALGEDAPDLRAPLLLVLAMEFYWTNTFDRAGALCREGLELARRSEDPRLLPQAVIGALVASWMPDNLEERLALCDEAIALGRERGDEFVALSGHHFRAVARLEASDAAGADADFERARADAERLRYPLMAHYTGNARVIRLIAAGRYEEAETLSKQQIELGTQLGSPHSPVLHGSHMMQLHILRGTGESVLGPLRGLAAVSTLAFPRAALASLLCVTGHPDEARAEFAALLEGGIEGIPANFFALGTLAYLSEAAAHLGEHEAARTLYERLLVYRGRSVVVGFATTHLGSVDRYLGLLAHALGDFDSARSHLDDAIRVERETGAATHLIFALENRAALAEGAAAARLRAEAAAVRDRIGMRAGELRVAEPESASAEAAPGTHSWLRSGPDEWTITWQDHRLLLPDARGIAYLAELLARPGEDVHVLDLLACVAPAGSVTKPAAGVEMLDERARREYRQRMAALQQEIEEAEERADTGRAERSREELETLEDALAGALGLGGRARRQGDAVERARKAVYNRIRDTVRRLERELPELAAHLRNSVRTGRLCVYEPERPTPWRVEA